MFSFSPQPKDRRIVSLARADYIIQKIRANLPPSSLCHEKLFGYAQLESLAIVSTGGLYAVNTFDLSAPDFRASSVMLRLSDLGVSVLHVHGSRNALTMERMERLVRDANDEFDQLIASDRASTVLLIRRVTVTIGYSLPGADVNEFTHQSFSEISRRLGLELTYLPYVTSECWLPDSDFYNTVFSSEDGMSAAEFVLPEPQTFDTVEALIKSSFASTGTIRPPGIHAKIPGRDQPYAIHFIGRSF
jgi:hypothetical protein